MATVSMIVNNNVIETKVLPNSHLKIEGYLQGLKNDMLERNDELIHLAKENPEFIVAISSRKVIRN
jgi:hypothetical protein